MRFGVQQPVWEPWDEARTRWRLIEKSRYTTAYVPDHPGPLSNDAASANNLDPWTVLAAVATQTKRIRLGTHVSSVTFRHPVLLAKIVGTLDVITGGRVTLGLGAGWLKSEHDAFGFYYGGYGERLDLLEENLAVLRKLWQEQPARYWGKFFELEAPWVFGPRPVQKPAPPIVVGGWSCGRLMRIAAKHADGFNLPHLGPDAARQRRARLNAHCCAVGRDPQTIELSADVLLLRNSDSTQAVEVISSLTAWRQRSGASGAQLDREAVLWGDASRIKRAVSDFERAGVTELTVGALHTSLDDLLWFSEEIIPEFAS